jgi:hypothetical protein
MSGDLVMVRALLETARNHLDNPTADEVAAVRRLIEIIEAELAPAEPTTIDPRMAASSGSMTYNEWRASLEGAGWTITAVDQPSISVGGGSSAGMVTVSEARGMSWVADVDGNAVPGPCHCLPDAWISTCPVHGDLPPQRAGVVA